MAKYCFKCGSLLEQGADFCGKCGQKIKNGSNNLDNKNMSTIDNNVILKSKIAAGLFGIFLGSFGVHNFYLGYTGKAVVQLLITLLSCGLFSPISAIWGLIEGILILAGDINKDAEGNPLGE